MRPLSDILITMLQTALKTRTTHVDLHERDGRLLWFHGDELALEAQIPDGAFGPVVDELKAFGATPESTSRITIQSPAGPITFLVDLTNAKMIRLVLRDAATADAEAAFGELMATFAASGAERATCANGEARFTKKDLLIASAPLTAEVIALLVTHGTALGGISGDARSGRAILFGGGQKRVLGIELIDGGIAFAFESDAAPAE